MPLEQFQVQEADLISLGPRNLHRIVRIRTDVSERITTFGDENQPEDGGNTVLRNVGSHTDYTALYPRIWQKACSPSSHQALMREMQGCYE
jgi:hypothetical protein